MKVRQLIDKLEELETNRYQADMDVCIYSADTDDALPIGTVEVESDGIGVVVLKAKGA